VIGQLFSDRSVVMPATPALLLRLGRGTDGGLVVHLRAAKYKQSAGPSESINRLSITTPDCALRGSRVCLPVIIRSPSALPSSSVSTNRSTLAWVREDLRYEWKQSWTNSSDRRSGPVVVVMDQGMCNLHTDLVRSVYKYLGADRGTTVIYSRRWS
jgi:hypothetical protein